MTHHKRVLFEIGKESEFAKLHGKNYKSIIKKIEAFANTTDSKEEVLNYVSGLVSATLIKGFGGSHIWVSNSNKERLLMIAPF